MIESILLGIPLPPIFVSQRPDGVWDVIDGLQRLSGRQRKRSVGGDVTIIEDGNIAAVLR